MLPDFLHDLKQVGVNPQDMSPLFNSAEAFPTTWTRVVERTRCQATLRAVIETMRI